MKDKLFYGFSPVSLFFLLSITFNCYSQSGPNKLSQVSLIVNNYGGSLYAKNAHINGNYLYTMNGGYINSGYSYILDTYDISNPESPVRLNTQTFSGKAGGDMIGDSGYLYVTGYESGHLSIFDLSTPSTPALVSSTTQFYFKSAWNQLQSRLLFKIGNTIYMTAGWAGIIQVDVSSAIAPVYSGIQTTIGSGFAGVLQAGGDLVVLDDYGAYYWNVPSNGYLNIVGDPGYSLQYSDNKTGVIYASGYIYLLDIATKSIKTSFNITSDVSNSFNYKIGFLGNNLLTVSGIGMFAVYDISSWASGDFSKMPLIGTYQNNATTAINCLYNKNDLFVVSDRYDYRIYKLVSIVAPVSTAATGISASSFTANWNEVADASGYQLDISLDNFVTYVTGYNSLVVTGTSKAVTGLTPSTNYSYRVRAINSGAASINSNIISVNTSVLVKQDQTITFNSLPVKSVGDATFQLTATASSGLLVSYGSSNVSVATIVGNTVTIVGAGTTTITASQGGNTNFNTAMSAQQILTINKANQTITFNALSSKIYGASPFAMSATASSGLPVTYSSSNTSVATVNASTVSIVGVGTTTITASQIGNANYNAAVNVLQDLSVSKSNQTITFTTLITKTFGDSPFALTASASSGLPITYTSSNTSVATLNGNTVTIVGAGNSTITATQTGNGNFNVATTVPQALTVNKTNQTITFNTLIAKTFGDAPFAVNATISSGLPITYISSNTGVATINANTVTIVGAGSTIITASQTGNSNYNLAANVPQTLTVSKATQTIAFDNISDKSIAELSFSLNASASSGLPLVYSSTNNAVATVAGNVVTFVAIGTTIIRASQSGNVNYNSASSVGRTLTVINKKDQTITFNAIAPKTMGDHVFTLNATSSSGLAVNYNTSSSKITISESQMTLIGAGSVTINADQPGNASYNAAPRVSQTFCINPAKPTIAVSNIHTESPLMTSSSTSGNQWFFNDIIIEGANSSTLGANEPGVYKVLVTIEGCVSQFSDDTSIVITGDVATRVDEFQIFPNPVQDFLFIKTSPINLNKVVMVDMMGKKLSLIWEKSSDIYRTDTSWLPVGIYIVRVGARNIKVIKN